MSDSDDDIRPPPPGEEKDIFGSDSDDDMPPPPPPKSGGGEVYDSDDEPIRQTKTIKTTNKETATKSSAADEGGDGSDDNLPSDEGSVQDSEDGEDADPSKRREIERRKSFGPDDDSDDDDDDEDDEDDYDSEEDEDGAAAAPAKSKAKKRSRDDTEEGGKKTKKPKKKKRGGVSSFFADMADVGDEDDEDEEEQGERGVTEEELTAEEMAANALVEARHAANRVMMETDADQLAKRYEDQHRNERRRQKVLTQLGGGSGGVGGGTVAQQALLPSIQDPSLWRVKCATGREFQLVRSILLRHIDQMSRGGRQTTLKSAFHSGAKGFIYIEAFSEVCAKEAVTGLRGLYVTSFVKVSIAEMTAVISATVHKKPLRVGQWVRLRRGPLRGDLARIVDLLEGGARAFVMAVPRPDYSNAGKTTSSQGTVRPPQKIFDVVEAQQSSGMEAERRQHPADRRGDHFDFWKNDYFKDGFWYKEVNTDSYLQGNEVKPRLEELQLFRSKTGDGHDSEDEEEKDEDEAGVDKGSMQKQLLKELADTMRDLEGEEAAAESANIFRPGDLIEIIGGEMRGVIAQINRISLTSALLEVVPHNNELLGTNVLTVEMALCVKYVFPGAHVKIIGGRYIGSTGRVVSVSVMDGDHVAAILTDGINSEIQVNVSNIQISAEVSIGHGDLGGYELFDCVSLSENETAVVIFVGTEKLRVINHMNVVKDVYPQDISSKRNAQSLKQSAFDSAQTTIKPNDIVKVSGGNDYVGKTGTVKHIMRGNLWIHSNNHLKNSGVMVVRGRSCVLAGSNQAESTNARANATTGVGSAAVTIATTGGPGKFGAKDSAIGKTVKIIKGGFKGFLAQVVDATPTTYTCELLARVKKIVIDRVKCKEVGDKDGAYDKTSVGGVGASRYSDVVGALADVATPFLTAETPMHMQGSETPMQSGMDTPYQGNDTPGRTDDIWKVNESDRTKNLPPPQLQEYELTFNEWQKSFIVFILDGSCQNRHGVIVSLMDHNGFFEVALIEMNGQLHPQTHRIPPASMTLAELKLTALVKVVHGDKGVVGMTGRCQWMDENDLVIKQDSSAGQNADLMFSKKHCAVVFEL